MTPRKVALAVSLATVSASPMAQAAMELRPPDPPPMDDHNPYPGDVMAMEEAVNVHQGLVADASPTMDLMRQLETMINEARAGSVSNDLEMMAMAWTRTSGGS